MIVDYTKWIMNIPIPLFFIFSFEKNEIKNFNMTFFLDTVVVRSFKLCIIITLLGVYIFIVDLMTLTVSRSQMYQKYKLQIALSRFLLGFFFTEA